MTITDSATTQRHAAMKRRLLHDLALEVAAGHYTVEVVRGAVIDNAANCREAIAAFCRLVEAVKDLTAYAASRESEGEWLVGHGIKPSEETRETYLGVIEERIEHSLDELTCGAA